MKEHQISAPQSSSPPIGKGHALSARATTSVPSWILDSEVSHHIKNTAKLLTSLAPCATTQISIGNSSQLSILVSGIVALVGGSLQDVLYVPDISMNLLSIYQIFHSSSGKTIEFSPHDVVIRDLHDPEMIVATRSADYASCLYRFNGFESSDDTRSCYVIHVDLVSKLWHEHFGHVNY